MSGCGGESVPSVARPGVVPRSGYGGEYRSPAVLSAPAGSRGDREPEAGRACATPCGVRVSLRSSVTGELPHGGSFPPEPRSPRCLRCFPSPEAHPGRACGLICPRASSLRLCAQSPQTPPFSLLLFTLFVTYNCCQAHREKSGEAGRGVRA